MYYEVPVYVYIMYSHSDLWTAIILDTLNEGISTLEDPQDTSPKT